MRFKLPLMTTDSEKLLASFNILKTEYISMLNDKDVLVSWGKPQLEALYNTRIGYLQIEKLQVQLRIKALKRKIELVQAAINQEKEIDINEMELQVAAELASAEYRIMNEINKLEKSKLLLSNLDSPQRSHELRKLYKAFAKQLHPDVNDSLTAEQKNLWYIIKEAYENGDLEKMKALKLVYEKELTAMENSTASFSDEELTLKIEVLKEGIKVLHEQIVNIKNEFPFTFESKIKDDEWIGAQQQELKNELQKLNQYENELTLKYQHIIQSL